MGKGIMAEHPFGPKDDRAPVAQFTRLGKWTCPLAFPPLPQTLHCCSCRLSLVSFTSGICERGVLSAPVHLIHIAFLS